MKNIKGFTLIELLIVIAIIGVLTAVVMASLNIAREKGANAGIKQDLNNARSQAEIYYSNNESLYTGLCLDETVLGALDAVNKVSGLTATCNDSSNEWAISSPLKTSDGTSKYWCVDGAGTARENTSPLGSATVCP